MGGVYRLRTVVDPWNCFGDECVSYYLGFSLFKNYCPSFLLRPLSLIIWFFRYRLFQAPGPRSSEVVCLVVKCSAEFLHQFWSWREFLKMCFQVSVTVFISFLLHLVNRVVVNQAPFSLNYLEGLNFSVSPVWFTYSVGSCRPQMPPNSSCIRWERKVTSHSKL